MNTPANAGDDFEKRLHRGAVLRLTLDKATLGDPDIDKRSKYVIVVSALLPDEDVWFIICTSKTGHFLASVFLTCTTASRTITCRISSSVSRPRRSST